jgi:hypothetical protein
MPVDFSVEGAVKKVLKRSSSRDLDIAQRVLLALAEELLDGTVAGEQRLK